MFKFENLDEKTRSFMVEAIEVAESSGDIYFSSRFNDAGKEGWIALLKEAAKEQNEHWLAFQLETQGLMKGLEGSRTRSGGYTLKHVPHTAAETMAEGQFNRFYILGLCKRAKAENITELEIYRARKSAQQRAQSQELVGSKLSVDFIESQLTKVADSFKSPLVKPNSGISVKIC